MTCRLNFLIAALILPASAQTTFTSEKVLFRNNSPGKPLLADLDGDKQTVELDGDSGLPNLYFRINNNGAVRARGSFIRRRDWQEVGLTYTIERSPDLGPSSWVTLNPGSAFTLNNDYQRATFNRLVSGKPKKHFQRIRIEYEAPGP